MLEEIQKKYKPTFPVRYVRVLVSGVLTKIKQNQRVVSKLFLQLSHISLTYLKHWTCFALP